MLEKGNKKLGIALIAVLVAAGVLAGGVVGSQFDGLPGEGFQASLESDAAVRVAGIPAQSGLPARSVLVQPTSTGHLCLWDAPNASSKARQGGCNRADDPLAGRKVTISLAYEGGPEIADVTDARLIGLVSSDASSVQVIMSDGSRRTIPMARETAVAMDAGGFRAFGYRFPRSDFQRGLAPTAVVALDAGGAELDRLSTGYG
jgi:hypothetical protein